MAIEIASFTNIAEAANTTSFTVTKPTGLAVDDLLLAIIAKDDDPVIDTPSGWTKHTVSGGDYSLAVLYKIADSSDVAASNFTFTGDSEEYAGRLYRITGHDTTTPMDIFGTGNTGTSTTPQALTITPTKAHALAFAVAGMDDDDTPYSITTANWTEDYAGVSGTGAGTCGVIIGVRAVEDTSATGACNFSTNASDGWAAVQFAIRPAVGTVTHTMLTTGTDNSDPTDGDYTTASISPGANKLILASVTNFAYAANDNDEPTLSGNGLTWVKIGTVTADGVYDRITLFRAMGSSPTTGAVTINFPTRQDSCMWCIHEFDNVDTGGTNGSAAVVQFATNSATFTSDLTVTLSAFSDTDNATYGCFQRWHEDVSSDQEPGNGFTELEDFWLNFYASFNQGMHCLFRDDNDTTVDSLDGDTFDGLGGIAIEIKASAATEVALTGVAGTSAVGTVDKKNDQDTTGNAGTSAVGAAAAALTIALTGVVGTSDVGSVGYTESGSTSISGNAGTSAVGTVDNSRTVSLSGVGSTSAVGTVDKTVTIDLTGEEATAAVGTVGYTKSGSLAITGNVGTSAVGSVGFTESGSVGVTGVAGTSAVGTVGVSVGASADITGVAGTSAVSTVDPSLAKVLTGNASIGGVGTVVPQLTLSLSGNEATSAVGSVGYTESGQVGLTGVAGTSAVGTVGYTKSGSLAITGVEGTSAVGTVTPTADVTEAVTGVAATSAVGSVGFTESGQVALTGVVGTGAVDSVTGAIVITVTGVEGTSAVDSVGFTESGQVALTGVSGTSAVGSVGYTESGQVGITGVEGISAVGTVGYTKSGSAAITGNAGTSAVGSVSVTFNIDLTGVEGTSAVGNVTVLTGDIEVAVSGVSSTAAVGTVGYTKAGSAVLSGVETTISVGNIAPWWTYEEPVTTVWNHEDAIEQVGIAIVDIAIVDIAVVDTEEGRYNIEDELTNIWNYEDSL